MTFPSSSLTGTLASPGPCCPRAAFALQFLPQDVEEYLGLQVPLCMCQPIVVQGGETQIDLHVSNLSWANPAKGK